MALVEKFHRRAGIRLPDATLHAVIHTVVENQIAAGLAPVVNALRRLQADGLDRHEAIHAIGAMLAAHMRQIVTGELTVSDPNSVYFATLDELSAKSWRRELAEDDHSD